MKPVRLIELIWGWIKKKATIMVLITFHEGGIRGVKIINIEKDVK
jgi:hypothetical protein